MTEIDLRESEAYLEQMFVWILRGMAALVSEEMILHSYTCGWMTFAHDVGAKIIKKRH